MVTCLFIVLVQQIILNCNALPSLLHLLSNSRESIRKEACWTISNITAGNRAQIQVRLDALNRIKNYIGCRINGLFLITLQLKKKKNYTIITKDNISNNIKKNYQWFKASLLKNLFVYLLHL